MIYLLEWDAEAGPITEMKKTLLDAFWNYFNQTEEKCFFWEKEKWESKKNNSRALLNYLIRTKKTHWNCVSESFNVAYPERHHLQKIADFFFKFYFV